MSYQLAFWSLAIISSISAAPAQQTHRPLSPSARTTPQPQTNPVLTDTSLRTEGVRSAANLRNIYVGDFAHVEMSRTGTEFYPLFSSFLTTFSKDCSAFLPSNKVHITEPYCAVTRTHVDEVGNHVGVDTCAQDGRKPVPGLYADPAAVQALESVEAESNRNTAAGLMKGIRDGSLQGVYDLAVDDKVRDQEMSLLFRQNGCGSPALARLQKNMTLFASGGQPIYLDGSSVEPVGGAPPAADLNVDELAADLIAADAKSWTFNQFAGHVGAQLLPGRDKNGRPLAIVATYDQRGIVSSGSVRITFADGVPACLYFADDAETCKAPSQLVLTKYLKGSYSNEQTASTPPVSEASKLSALLTLYMQFTDRFVDQDDIAAVNGNVNAFLTARQHGNITPQQNALAGVKTMENKYMSRCHARDPRACKAMEGLNNLRSNMRI